MKALITGASSGIGRDMARELAKKGYDLIITARRADRLEQLKDELTNVNVRCITADLSNPDECIKLYEQTREEKIDFLINNAGFGIAGEFISTDLESEMKLIDTNIKALHILTKLFLRDFVERDSGTILNVASSAGFMPGPLLSSYYASKNYVLRLSEAIYEELRRKNSNVHISVLCPGPVDTEFNNVAQVKFSLKGLTSEYVARYAISKALKGKLLIIPGKAIKTGLYFRRFLSEKSMLKISYKFQKRKNK